MAKITDLRPGKGRGQRMNIFLDGKFAISVGAGVAAREGLRTEQTVTDDQLESLARADRFERCLAAATRYLAVRPRSQSEMKERLMHRGFDSDTRSAVMAKLEGQGLLNDAAFARLWADSREASSPRSRLLTRLELRKKGVPADVIDAAVNDIDDEANAHRAAISRLRSLQRSDREEFRRRLGAYLQRRGFAYEVVRRTVERVWLERESSADNEGTAGRSL